MLYSLLQLDDTTTIVFPHSKNYFSGLSLLEKSVPLCSLGQGQRVRNVLPELVSILFQTLQGIEEDSSDRHAAEIHPERS